jgi:ubiquinone/menaquinone biosynthesis C-methylase UbiE
MMIDLRTLTPAERARQLGHPEGEVGRALAEGMNTTNRGAYERVFRRLHLRPGFRVLEVGFGNGRFLPLLMSQAEGIRYVGIDISETMVAEAMRSNRALIGGGGVAFHCGSADALPYPDGSFDRAFAVAVIYFWPEPAAALAEMRRVLRPGGRSIIVALHPEIAASADFARPEYGFRVYDEDTLLAMHRKAGFRRAVVEFIEETVTRPDGSVTPLRAYLVLAER